MTDRDLKCREYNQRNISMQYRHILPNIRTLPQYTLSF
ncbi:hypothetical protein MmTuc01_3166 [Methanosarcina mazei Tuc01]|uniref:Uncharacterized protein n=1 Tax=Methanosarcina mazei Tuc01 TaxID=1236903 RepID=M1QDW5_METMZ|nr:hypothetical protein MmTuc01_3166 [Methanosarcina mazei Tuc01]